MNRLALSILAGAVVGCSWLGSFCLGCGTDDATPRSGPLDVGAGADGGWEADGITPSPDTTPAGDTRDTSEMGADTAAPQTAWVPADLQDLARYVDPMIGTDGPGNVIPGAVLPHGMIRLSPDTDEDPMGIDAYDYSDPRIQGFTHTHLEGPGGSFNGYSQVLLMPTTSLDAVAIGDWAAAYSHDDEVAEPGYYAVSLATGVRVELTADAHAGIHRYTFPEGAERRVILDLWHSNGDSEDGHIQFDDAHTVSGFGRWNVHPLLKLGLGPDQPTGDQTVFFTLRTSAAITSHAFFRSGKRLDKGAEGLEATAKKLGVGLVLEPTVVLLEIRIAISFVDASQAQTNFDAEATVDFDAMRAAAKTTWNHRLNRVQVTGSEDIKRRFYTALYHAMLQPADHTEVGGRFALAASGALSIHEAGAHRYYTDDWCMWDTFRTSHPLATLVEPETRPDLLWSLLQVAKDGGWLPKCTWTGSGYSRVMIGNHAIPIIADAVVKGLGGDVDMEALWAAVDKTGTQDTATAGDDGLCGYLNLGTRAEYLSLGYVPSECDGTQSVSMTLEYAYDDWATARLAEALGKEAARAAYDLRGQNWRHHWNPEVGFMAPKMADGSWRPGFDPADFSDSNDFAEASSWIYSWFVPHDLEALFELMGGHQAVLERLDAFFDGGYYDVSNQPSFHVPWLYTRAGAPDRSQAKVREIMDARFVDTPKGLPGNDDAGSMSAWFVLSALGLYPMAPGEPRWDLGAPLVDAATIQLHPGSYDGGAFVIEVERSAPEDRYVQSATLNGAPLNGAPLNGAPLLHPWLSHSDLVAGGTLHLVVGSEPSGFWGE